VGRWAGQKVQYTFESYTIRRLWRRHLSLVRISGWAGGLPIFCSFFRTELTDRFDDRYGKYHVGWVGGPLLLLLVCAMQSFLASHASLATWLPGLLSLYRERGTALPSIVKASMNIGEPPLSLLCSSDSLTCFYSS
jgi:hypothetical protein